MGKKDKAAKQERERAESPPRKPARKLEGTVRPYVQHVLVCTDSKSRGCKKGGPAILKAFQSAIKKHRLQRQVIVTAIKHIGGCSLGPNVIIYPDGVWYGLVKDEDVEEIVATHLIGGEVVSRLTRGSRIDGACGGCALQPNVLEPERMAA
jgi:(2Fe-2S) ferredoxin